MGACYSQIPNETTKDKFIIDFDKFSMDQVKLLMHAFLLETSDKDRMIPNSIIFFINAYSGGYQMIDTEFDILGEGIQFDDNNKLLITNHYDISPKFSTAYCALDIDGVLNLSYIIEIKIHQHPWDGGVFIGIQRKNSAFDPNVNFASQRKNPYGQYYAYCSSGRKFSHQSQQYGEKFATKYGEGDTVWMKLKFKPDANYGTLRFRKNDETKWYDSGYVIPKSTKINVCVSLFSKANRYASDTKNSLELMSVKIKNNNYNHVYKKY